MMTQAIPEKLIGIVAAVCHIRQMVLLQKGNDLFPCDCEHRTDQPAIYRGDAAKALQSRTPNHVHQHGFCIIVCGVRSGDLAGKGVQKGVSCIPGCCFKALLSGKNFPGADSQRNIIPVTKLPDKLFICVRFFSTQSMIKMCSTERNTQLFTEQIHSKQQRHRIRAAGNGTGHMISGAQHLIPPNKGQKLIQHASTPGL